MYATLTRGPGRLLTALVVLFLGIGAAPALGEPTFSLRDQLGGGAPVLLADWGAGAGALGDTLSDGSGYRVSFTPGEATEEAGAEQRTAPRPRKESQPRWRTVELARDVAGRSGAYGVRLPAAPAGRPYTVTVRLPEARASWVSVLGDGADGVFADGARRVNRFDRRERGADLVFAAPVDEMRLTVSEGAPAGLVLAGPFGSEPKAPDAAEPADEAEKGEKAEASKAPGSSETSGPDKASGPAEASGAAETPGPDKASGPDKATGAPKPDTSGAPKPRTEPGAAPRGNSPARRAANCTPSSAFTNCTLYSYTGADQTFTVPAGISSVNVQLWGGGGGGDNAQYYTAQKGGGGGGYTTGTLAVTAGQQLTVMSGQGGLVNSTTGTYGGGGAGGASNRTIAQGGSGGGMSALWTGASFGTPLLIAGGGGGASPGSDTLSPSAGGGGGSSGGGDGVTSASGQGGTQSAGGAAGTNGSQCAASSNTAGQKWYGGNGFNAFTNRNGEGGGGGGGGYYGGGGGACQNSFPTNNPNGPGGGGSGYIGGAGVSGASTTAGANAPANNQGGNAAGTSSAQYPSGVGTGGSDSQAGGNGAVVIQWLTQTSLSVTKTATPNPYTPGNRVTYQITVSNAGPAPAPNAAITDTVPSGLTGVTWTCGASAGASCGSSSGSGNSISTTATIPANGRVIYTVTGTTASSATATLTNTATVTPPSGVRDTTCGTGCSATATTPAQASADLSAAKQASTANVSPGQTYTYTLTASNAGPSDAQSVSMTDTLPNNVTFRSGSGCTASGQNVTCGPVATVASGASTSWTITVLLASSYKGNGSDIGNTATVSSSTSDPNSSNNSGSSGPPPIVPQSDFDVTSSTAGGPVAPGSTTTIPVVVKNNGPADAQGNVTVAVNLPSGVTASGTQPSGCTANSAGTTVTCTVPAASLASGQSVNLPIGVLVSPSAAPNSTLTQPGGITVSGPNDNVSSNNQADAVVRTSGATNDLAVTKSASPTSVNYGSTTVFTVTVTNNGPSAATGVQVTDQLPSGLTYVSDDANGAYNSGTGVWTVGALANGASATLHITARMTSTSAQTNTVSQATSNGTDPTPCSNCASATVTPVAADLATTKSATGTPVAPGQTFQYQITVTNNGPSAAANVSVTDTLPSQLAFVSSSSGCTASGQSVTCPQIASLANGSSQTFTITARVDPSYTGNGSDIANTASAGSSTPDPTPGNNTSPPSSPQVSGVQTGLSITKTGSSTSYQPGQTFSYTVTVSNSGPSTAAGPSVADTLPSGFSNFSWNCAASNGSSCGAASGSGNISDAPTILPSGTITYTISGTVPAATSGNQTNNATVTAASGTTDSNCKSTCTASVVTNGPSVQISKTSTPAPAKPGQTVTYTVTLKNNGGGDATNFSYSDNLSDVVDDATFNSSSISTSPSSAGNGTYNSSNTTLTWTGTVPAGGTVTVTYQATVNNPPGGNQVLNNAVTAPGTNCAAGSKDANCSDDNGGGIPRLSISKTSNASGTVKPGQKVVYTVTLTNPGTATYTGGAFTDDLTDVIDDAAYNNDASASVGSVSYTAPNVTWNGTLAAGASATVTYSATVDNPDTSGNQKLVNQVTSSSDTNCPSGGSSSSCTTTNSVAALKIAKTVSDANPKPGEKVTYTVTVQNTGAATYAGATWSDDLSDVIDDAAYGNDASATAGSVSWASPKLTWTGDVAAGTTVTITYSATVNNPDTGNGQMVNAVTGPADSNCPPGNTSSACSTGNQPGNGIPQLKITKTQNPTAPAAGQTITYTVIAQNTGTAVYTGATWSDDLSSLTDDGTYNNDAKASAGTVSYSAPTLSWTGDLQPGTRSTTTYTVTLGNPDPGDKQLTNLVTSTSDTNCGSGSTSSECGNQSPVPVKQLTMKKSASTTTPKPGDKVTYTVTVQNSGTAAYPGATFNDDLTALLDDAAYNNDANATSGSVSYSSPTVSWTGDLAVGATATITYSVTIDAPDNGDQVLTNTLVSTSAGSNCRSGSTDPNCTAGPYDVPSVQITKTVSPAKPLPGDTITYTVSLVNTGSSDYDGASFTDDLTNVLDDATWLDQTTPADGSVTYASPKLSWTGDVPVGQTQTVTYAVKLNDPTTGDGKVTNSVVGPAGSNCAPGSTDNRCTAAIDGLPELHISKSVSPVNPVAGQKATYTVTVQNTGSATYTGASWSDDLTSVLDDAAYNNDASATAGSVSWASPKLSWTGDVTAGASATITYSVTVDYPDTGDQRLNNTVTGPQGSNCMSGSTDTDCGSSSGVGQLKLSKSYTPQAAVPGSKVTYTVTVQNTGTGTYPDATWSDDLTGVLDDAAYDNDASADSGSTSWASPQLTWSGDLAAGQTATITYSVTVNDPDTGDKQLANTVTGPAGSNCAAGSTDPACAPSPAGVPTLSIAKSASSSTPTPGTKVTYTVTVQNTGTATYAGATWSDDLTDVLDDAAYGNDASATAGSVSYASPKVSWTGDVAAGATVTITYSATVNTPDTGNGKLVNSVVGPAGSNCEAGKQDASCSTGDQPGNGIPQLALSKTSSPANPVPGTKVTYTVTARNTGTATYSGATFTDDLTDVIDDAAYGNDASATAGSVSWASPKVSWTGDLAAGASATVTYSATVDNPDTGNKTLTNSVVGPTGSNCAQGAQAAACSTSTGSPQLTLNKTYTPSNPLPGDKVTYTVTARNTGTATYPGATWSDDLTGVLDDATYNADANASIGTVSYASPKLSWTGDVPAGQTATVTYSVTVNDPDTGDKQLSNTVTGTPDATCATCTPPPVGVPQLAIAKSASDNTPKQGEKVTYTVTVQNTGAATYTGATWSDDLSGVLDDAAYGNDASATAGSVSWASPKVSWTGDVAAGATVTITYSVTVDNPDTGDMKLANSVVGPQGSNCEAGKQDASCSTGDQPGNGIPVLKLKKTVSAATTAPGSTVTYTITAQNTGTATYTGAQWSDDLSGVLDDATYNNDADASSGTASYASPNLTWTGDVPAGQTVTTTYTVTINSPSTSTQDLTNTVTSSPDTNCPSGTANSDCTASVGIPQVSITKTASTTSPMPGQKVTYTVTVQNTGTVVYPGATFTDDLTDAIDDSAYDNDANATIGTASWASPELTWTGDVPVGQTATVTYSVTVDSDPASMGNGVLKNAVTSTGPGTNCTTAAVPGCSTTSSQVPTLRISKTQTTTVVLPGGTVSYQITITNPTASDYPNAAYTDDLTGVLDDASYNDDADATSGTASWASPKLTWSGDVPGGQTVTLTYSVTVNTVDTGDGKLANTVVANVPGSNCPAGSTDSDCTTGGNNTGGLIPHLKIVKTVDNTDPLPGDLLNYTVTVTNDSLAAYPGATFTDQVTQGSGLINQQAVTPPTATSGTISDRSGFTYTWTGDMAAGASASVTYTYMANAVPGSGNRQIVNQITNASANTTCYGNGADAGYPTGCGATVVAPLYDFGEAPNSYGTTTSANGPYHVIVPGLGLGDGPVAGLNGIPNGPRLSRTTGRGPTSIPTAYSSQRGYATQVELTNTTGSPVLLAAWLDYDFDGVFSPGERITRAIGNNATTASLSWPSASFAKAGTTYMRLRLYGEQVPAGRDPQVPVGETLVKVGGKLRSVPFQKAAPPSDPKPTGYGGAGQVEDFKIPVVQGTLKVAITSDNAHPKPGDKVTYTITVCSPSGTPYTGATASADLTQALKYATYNNDAAASAGSVKYSGGKVSWKGTASGDCAHPTKITFSVTYRAVPPGTSVDVPVTGGPSGSNCPAGSKDPVCNAVVEPKTPVKPLPDTGGSRGMSPLWGLAALVLLAAGLLLHLVVRRHRSKGRV
ncbi:isopeptide-forming domain-containing fimbrial protein [Streptomyces sp. 4F14]|uniref:DUF7927 domain-containing protein n=1 Tax=Streptomyces sp. 4F14 TaxID=3394380 RepID=UPI003A86D2DE